MHIIIHVYMPTLLRFEVTVSGFKGSRSRHPSKVEPSNYYMSRARYSPLSTGRSKGNTSDGPNGRIAFGSSAPRWPQGNLKPQLFFFYLFMLDIDLNEFYFVCRRSVKASPSHSLEKALDIEQSIPSTAATDTGT